MHLDKAIVTNSRSDSFEPSRDRMQYGEMSVLIKNHNGQPSKLIRIASSINSQNLEIEFTEEERPNHYIMKG